MDDAEANSSRFPLPEALLDFLNQNGINPSIYAASDSIPRYIRLKPGNDGTIEEIEADIGCKLEKVYWLPDFYHLPPDVRIASSKAYRQGMIYGIDAASGAAVSALDISVGDHVLDLCAAPGAKLCMILDCLGSDGTVTGVDVAKHRLAACRSMLLKYGLGDHCRLFVADGTTFSLLPIKANALSETQSDSEVYKEWNSRRPWKERKREAIARENGSCKVFQPTQEPELIFYGRNSGVVGLTRNELYQMVHCDNVYELGYDKVLVDAECTHDGSIKHIQKFEQWGWTTFRRRVLEAERTDDLAILQLQLLTNGFRLLKVGGFLVYSTCSLTVAQNEDVVDKFLSENSSAELVEIEAAKSWPCKNGRIPKTLRFDPLTSRTSGLFVAKFTKLAIQKEQGWHLHK
ncbi:hypothetical protein DM860_004787 [Cuscuta australis]|uniref:SAM-dependent MTase RsmB/NOP-type domain-containing protein n=1 Tax=Cuscuta australis TaxID=267555 RepID=A0A328DPB6_9ASTE|nr:hypothetical protein DM860_004787 [Cuscuta australis]